jgi:hypothetical protein
MTKEEAIARAAANPVSEHLAKCDLMTALTIWADEGEVLAERVGKDGLTYLRLVIRRAVESVSQAAAHEQSRKRRGED